MIKVKINGVEHAFPTRWEDLTFKQFIDIWTEREGTNDHTKLLSILAGVDLSRADIIVGLTDMVVMAGFLNTPSRFEESYPNVGPYKIKPNKPDGWDIRFESLGQFEDMRALFGDKTETMLQHTKKYARYVAIYLQKIRDGEYDPLKTDEMEHEVMKYPAGEVVWLGGFFFAKLLISLRGISVASPDTALNQKKSKPALNGSKPRSASTPPSPKSRRR